MRASILLFVSLIVACLSLTQAARINKRCCAKNLKKRQFAPNSQLINLEQNGDIIPLFASVTNVASSRGRANSEDGDKSVFGGDKAAAAADATKGGSLFGVTTPKDGALGGKNDFLGGVLGSILKPKN